MIDPKKISAWGTTLMVLVLDERSRLSREQGRLLKIGDVASARERLQVVEEALRALDDLQGGFTRLAVDREEMLALLRLVEWVGDEFLAYVCPVCQRQRPHAPGKTYEYPTDDEHPQGHAPDCRLAAFLR